MNILIGDIGNTSTKICIINNKELKLKKILLLESKKIISRKYVINKLSKLLKKRFINKKALFSSVVPKYEKILREILNKKYKIKLIEIKKREIKKVVRINIKNKNQVGSDRIANAVGVYNKYKNNCIVLDFGTATTFDVVTKNGFYNGGVIAPGVNLSIKSLSSSADLIPNFSIKKQSKIIGKNTLEALRSGFYWGYSGLINNIILKIEKETKKKYRIIFTGGYAKMFENTMKRPFVIDKNLTINGIIEIFRKNKDILTK